MSFELLSPRLTLRALRLEDAPAIWAYRSVPEVARFQSWESFSLQDAEQLVVSQGEVVPNTAGTWLQLALIERASGHVIGDCGIHFRSDEREQVELGITLSPTHQGRGLAQEAMQSVLGYVFGTLGKHRAIAITDVLNHASIRLLNRVGFRQEAHFVEHVWYKGAWGSEYLFAMLGREWRGRQS